MRELSAEDIAATSRRARYTAGRLATGGGADGRWVPKYVDEDGVDAKRYMREAWDHGLVPMEEYPAGSTGPS